MKKNKKKQNNKTTKLQVRNTTGNWQDASEIIDNIVLNVLRIRTVYVCHEAETVLVRVCSWSVFEECPLGARSLLAHS